MTRAAGLDRFFFHIKQSLTTVAPDFRPSGCLPVYILARIAGRRWYVAGEDQKAGLERTLQSREVIPSGACDSGAFVAGVCNSGQGACAQSQKDAVATPRWLALRGYLVSLGGHPIGPRSEKATAKRPKVNMSWIGITRANSVCPGRICPFTASLMTMDEIQRAVREGTPIEIKR